MRFPGRVIKDLFSPPKPPDIVIPPIPKPAVMPDPDDQALLAKKRREAALLRRKHGRLSTINTGPETTAVGTNLG